MLAQGEDWWCPRMRDSINVNMSAYQRWMNVGFDKRRCTARLDFGAPSVLYIEADAQSGDSGHRADW
ncbi:hypothetical protein DMENIID0001_146690 [Sergentomyia squamirostris]